MLSDVFLIVWNDVDAAAEDEYLLWHRSEHMPERLAIPGFDLGRRYANAGALHSRYLTIYEVKSPGVFASDAYRQSLAAPTEWTIRMSAKMQRFVRRVCRTLASEGVAIGGGVATFQLKVAGEAASGTAWADSLVKQSLARPRVVAAHVGVVDPALTTLRTDDMQYREEAAFDAVLIVETDSLDAAEGLVSESSDLARGDGLRSSIEITGRYVHGLALVYRPSA